jgi:hypothetical protein
LTNPNGASRSLATSAYDDLNGEQLEQLLGAIYYAAKNKAPSGIMFAGKGEANSIIKLAEARFIEGLPLALEYLTRDGWGLVRSDAESRAVVFVMRRRRQSA